MTFSNEDMMVVTARACAGAELVTAQTILDKLTITSLMHLTWAQGSAMLA